MTVGEAIWSILDGDASLTAVVPSTKIAPINLPMNTANPCIVYARSSSFPDYDKQDGKIVNMAYEIDIFSDTHKQAAEIADLVRAALDLNVSTHTGFVIDRIRFDGQDDRDFDVDRNTYQISQGYMVRVKYD